MAGQPSLKGRAPRVPRERFGIQRTILHGDSASRARFGWAGELLLLTGDLHPGTVLSERPAHTHLSPPCFHLGEIPLALIPLSSAVLLSGKFLTIPGLLSPPLPGKARGRAEGLSLLCIPALFIPAWGFSCLPIPLVPPGILCRARHAKATPALRNLQSRRSGFLGLAAGNCCGEGSPRAGPPAPAPISVPDHNQICSSHP